MGSGKTNREIWKLVAAASGWLALAAYAQLAVAAEIKIRAQAAPQGTVVRLGDVAEIRSDNGAEAKRLAATPLMPSPSSGTEPRLVRCSTMGKRALFEKCGEQCSAILR